MSRDHPPPRAPLRVAVAQPRTTAHDVVANVLAHAVAVRRAQARIVVFPELSLTGYELDADLLDPTDLRLTPLLAACREVGTVALAGAPVAGEGGAEHIGVLAVDGRAAGRQDRGEDRDGHLGVRVAYRKLWLGDEEAHRFTPGPAPAALLVDGWRLGLAVCKDTAVEQHALDTAALGIDGYLAGTVKHDHEADLQDARARRIAIDLGVWVAVASAAGPTGAGYHRTAGRSAIWSPEGLAVARADRRAAAVVAAELG